MDERKEAPAMYELSRVGVSGRRVETPVLYGDWAPPMPRAKVERVPTPEERRAKRAQRKAERKRRRAGRAGR